MLKTIIGQKDNIKKVPWYEIEDGGFFLENDELFMKIRLDAGYLGSSIKLSNGYEVPRGNTKYSEREVIPVDVKMVIK